MIIKKALLSITAAVMPLLLVAQSTGNEVDMADVMRSNGKIYVVVAVATIIMTGLIVYLVRLDMKISKLEKRISKNQS